MYESFFKLAEQPFQLSPDPRFFYESSGHKRALAYLYYGLAKREGFLVLTGEVGTGKTMLVATLLEELKRKGVVTARVLSNKMKRDDMLRMVAASFGLEHHGLNKAELMQRIEHHVIDLHRRGKRTLLVVDEVQNMAKGALEELRMLSNLQHENRAVLQIYLFGQHEFRGKLKRKGMEQFRQRVVAAYHLGALKPEEIRFYLEHRLSVAGWADDPLFTDDACEAIYRHCGGVPRKINTLCDRILLFACVEEKHDVNEAMVEEVFGELREETFIDVLDPDEDEQGEAVGGEARVPAAVQSSVVPDAGAGHEPAGVRDPKTFSFARSGYSGGLLCVAGARPNLMKIAPVMHALRAHGDPYRVRLVHTGQHYDPNMKDAFFEQLDMARPDIDLDVGSGTQAAQTAEIMRRFEPVMLAERPGAVLVVGDVNSTLACALVAVKCGTPVIHVEAGLRSGDRTMPEEINRLLTDQIAEVLFTTEPQGRLNLLREGIPEEKIFPVGNVMIDTLRKNLDRAIPPAETLEGLLGPSVFQPTGGGYALLTLHRPSNVDNHEILKGLLGVMAEISETLPVVFPIHPRAKRAIDAAGLRAVLNRSRVCLLPPIGYLEMLGLMTSARLVMTDSGGVQEETTALSVPCITLRENTERPITVEQGTNELCGNDPVNIRRAVRRILSNERPRSKVPELWDGNTAIRIREVLDRLCGDAALPGLRARVVREGQS